ncbi:MAG: glycoside hydrolase family 78 protein [Clostridia bacterium]|nr:glycoside hydrolase family 78 protein [Clostridia bacterium]
MAVLASLKAEKLTIPVGIDTQNPRFSWNYAAEAADKNLVQTSYQIKVVCACGKTVWDSGIVTTDKKHVTYAAEALKPAKDYTVTLKTTLSDGKTAEKTICFSTGVMDSGLLDNADFLSLPRVPGVSPESVPAFRHEFTPAKTVKAAKLFTVGAGMYEAYINGVRPFNYDADGNKVEYEMKPGFTEILKRKFYHSYNVTELVKAGANCITATVTSGWWSDVIADHTGELAIFKAALVLEYEDGTSEVIATSSAWKVSTEHPVVNASVYGGETYDARISCAYMLPGFDDSAWANAVVSHGFEGIVQSMVGDSVICRYDLTRKAVKVYTYKGAVGAVDSEDRAVKEYGKIDNVVNYDSTDFILHAGETAVIDFGQNAAGREYFHVTGKAGTKITIRHSEMLCDGNGKRSRGNDGPEGAVYIENLRGAQAATNYIIGSDKEEAFRPIYTFYGFRYLSITADADVHFSSIVGEVVTSINYDSGMVETGDTYVNQLISNSRWGMISNYLSISTDCPQRDERYGWTADTQVYTTTAQYYSTSTQSFHEKWTQDLRDSQGLDGSYPGVAPRGRYGNELGGTGWSDAGILVPYYVWRMSGDDTILKENYASMKLYMNCFMRHRGTAGTVNIWGDWLSFEPNDQELQTMLGVCYKAWDAALMVDMAKALGKCDDAVRYQAVYEEQKAYFEKTYVNEDGTVKLSQQCAALFALKLGLLPDEKSVEAVKAQLASNIANSGNRLQTGFLGTSILLPTLSDCGLNDIAYTLLLQDAMPSWLYSVKAGATTIWERWNSYSIKDGFGDVGMNSFNHYAYGCVSEWLFGYAAGVRPQTVGYQTITLAPTPDARIGHLSACYNSVCGLIKSAWAYEGEKIHYTCTVPVNATAVLTVPTTGEMITLGSGDYEFVW